jgi:(E)-4-hydroxy-3-methylbut-2-enyl-diphosphate synthase
MFTYRENTRVLSVGGVKIGGGNPVTIQSMINASGVEAAAEQLAALKAAGCEIARIAVPDMAAAVAIETLKTRADIPLVADVHFDARLAVAAIEHGADKLRLNPGNIGGEDKIRLVAKTAKKHGVPIRVGVNAGSLEKALLAKYGGVTAEAIAESALNGVQALARLDFWDVCVSVKTSSAALTARCYALLSEGTDCPLHVGVTEAGTVWSGAIKSAVGIGAVLLSGIGDTIRVSLTGDPLEEVKCAKEILRAAGLRRFGPELVSCPTCGRTEIDVIKIANEVERRLLTVRKDIKVAVMGCAVNGPGEAREADVGIAGGKGEGLIFKKGQIIAKAPENELITRLFAEIDSL